MNDAPETHELTPIPPPPALKSGCFSIPTLIPEADAIAAEIRAAALIECPWLTPMDGPTLDLYALALARVRRAEAHLIETGEYMRRRGGSVAHRALVGDMRAWVETARRLAGVLGLTPEARMSLKVGASRSRALDASDPADPADVAALEARLMARLGVK